MGSIEDIEWLDKQYQMSKKSIHISTYMDRTDGYIYSSKEINPQEINPYTNSELV